MRPPPREEGRIITIINTCCSEMCYSTDFLVCINIFQHLKISTAVGSVKFPWISRTPSMNFPWNLAYFKNSTVKSHIFFPWIRLVPNNQSLLRSVDQAWTRCCWYAVGLDFCSMGQMPFLTSPVAHTGGIGNWTPGSGRLKELDREDASKRPAGIVLRMTWNVQACPKRMFNSGINGERRNDEAIG